MCFPGYSYHKQFFLFIAFASKISAPPRRKILAAPLLPCSPEFVSSFSVHQAMLNVDVLTECIISDHRAVAVSIQCSHLPEFDDEVMEPQPSRIDWIKVTAQEREDYYHNSKNLLDQLQVPTEVRHCQNFNCTDEKHLEEI